MKFFNKISVKTILLVCVLAINIATLFILTGTVKKSTSQAKYSYSDSYVSAESSVKYYEVKKVPCIRKKSAQDRLYMVLISSVIM